jgi:Zn finger protein HypA/HybF involved in hydrogenase expression
MSIDQPTDDQIREAVRDHYSYTEIIRALDRSPAGSRFRWIKAHIKRLELDISHFKTNSERVKELHQKGAYSYEAKIPHEKFFSQESTCYTGKNIKNRILKEKLLEYKCHECNLLTWRDKPLTLHLDHINGDFMDNRLENLRFLCPNCHSQTPTYCRGGRLKVKNKCACGRLLSRHAKKCFDCYATPIVQKAEVYTKSPKKKIDYGDPAKLLASCHESSFVAVGKSFGVSDNAIRKHLRKHNLL